MTTADGKPSRAERNLRSANASRARKRLERAELLAETATLQESNAILRARLSARRTVGGLYATELGGPWSPTAPSAVGPPAPVADDDMVPIPPAFAKLFGGRAAVAGRALVELLDRVVAGDAKGACGANEEAANSGHHESEIVRAWFEAADKAPVNPLPALREACRPVGGVAKGKNGGAKRGPKGARGTARGAARPPAGPRGVVVQAPLAPRPPERPPGRG